MHAACLIFSLVKNVKSFSVSSLYRRPRSPSFVKRNSFLSTPKFLVRRYSSVTEPEGETTDRVDERANESPFSPVDSSSSGPQQQQQLWLDLRGTVLTPTEAFSFLQQELFDDDNVNVNAESGLSTITDLIDRVLLEEESFFKLVSSQSNFLDTHFDIFYTTSNGDLVAADKQLEQSFPIGRVVSCDDDEDTSFIDPILALDVTSRGDWLFIDYEKQLSNEDDATFWVEEKIGSLVEFLSSTSSSFTKSDSPPLPSGLLVPGASSQDTSGGLAIRCPNKQTLVQVDATFARSLYATMTTVTESGILVPTGISDTSTGTISSIATALVLPFEVLLWKSALELRTTT